MRVYLDNNATTAPTPDVIAAVADAMARWPGNPSSLHSFGQEGRRELDRARYEVATLVGARAEEVTFTSSGTEANNHILKTLVEVYRGQCHIITSSIEHASIHSTCLYLQSCGAEVTFVPVDDRGQVDPRSVAETIKPTTRLVSVMLANNDLGAIQPVAQISQVAKGAGILMHCDAVQAVGKIPVDFKALGLDLLSLSAHKFHGPRGVGALVKRQGLKLLPFFHGGKQERGLRAGTENLPAICGMAAAAQQARTLMTARSGHVQALRDHLEQCVTKQIPGARINGPVDNRLPNTSNLSFDGVNGQLLAIHLDMAGVAVSTGSACSSQSDEPSRILLALGRSPEQARESIRISLGFENTLEEIQYAMEALRQAVAEIRDMNSGAHR